MLRGTDGFFLRKMQDGEPEKAAKQIVGNLSPTPQPFRFSHLNKLLRSCIADRCVSPEDQPGRAGGRFLRRPRRQPWESATRFPLPW
ncbi:uncharacterized protein LOC115324686 isoform X2 [Ixodes scapularis]|uniref:uncharacterized protein LOC115324686 isoform X2 n=1 Tax=Ixodes scapularis TaxID=6945 RepID=UPI001A9F9FE5|nr:uncharacterized protein LOC115324686 isoform X2 [Ixodes scapularis]